MSKQGFTFADPITGKMVVFIPSADLSYQLSELTNEMRSAGIPIESIRTHVEGIARAVSDMNAPRIPITLQDIARKAAMIYLPRIEALEATQSTNLPADVAKLVGARLDQLEARQTKIYESISLLGQRQRDTNMKNSEIEERIKAFTKIYGNLEVIYQEQRNNNTVHSELEERLESLEAVNPLRVKEKAPE